MYSPPPTRTLIWFLIATLGEEKICHVGFSLPYIAYIAMSPQLITNTIQALTKIDTDAAVHFCSDMFQLLLNKSQDMNNLILIFIEGKERKVTYSRSHGSTVKCSPEKWGIQRVNLLNEFNFFLYQCDVGNPNLGHAEI
jgi:hypothetical protein